MTEQRPAEIEVIRGHPPSPLAGLRDLWRARHVAAQIVRRDIRLRYRQTLLGVAWAVLQPLLTALVFALIFGLWVRVPTGGVRYFEFAFVGLAAWLFFAGAVQHGTHSLLANQTLITKVYFPRAVLPIASVGLSATDLLAALAFLVPMLLWHGVGVHAQLLWVLPALALLFALTLGIVLASAALSVYYRDFPNLVPLALQLLMVASPVIYPMAIVPPAFQAWLKFNPLVGILELLRWAVFGVGEFPGAALAVALPVSVAVLVAGWLVFCRLERHFADEI
jgi:lipopolysaccharide transport system permease protein